MLEGFGGFHNLRRITRQDWMKSLVNVQAGVKFFRSESFLSRSLKVSLRSQRKLLIKDGERLSLRDALFSSEFVRGNGNMMAT